MEKVVIIGAVLLAAVFAARGVYRWAKGTARSSCPFCENTSCPYRKTDEERPG